MWRIPEDDTAPVLTAAEQLSSAHRGCSYRLPDVAVVYFMSGAADAVRANCACMQYPEDFPRFLNRCPIWRLNDAEVCFLNGGAGAPQAADTIETLAALGVKTVLSVGLIGAFSRQLRVGEIIAPRRAFVEEGASLHYYERIASASPDTELLWQLSSRYGWQTCPIVTTDAIYRQTFMKEQLWREQGAVGVDMETSAVFSVSKYLGLRAAAMLMASDQHPQASGEPRWAWHMTDALREDMAEKSISFARGLAEKT